MRFPGFALAYLDPPPFPAPVVVMKDVGGLVSDYMAQTERYRAEGREVRLHECRSACTLALSLPNVCVYPSSLLKFHKAYDQNTRVSDESVSRTLFTSYPSAVQARLGGLTREYHVLTGTELIALGMRNCEDGRVMMARARPQEPGPSASLDQTPVASVGGLFRGVLAALSPPTARQSDTRPAGDVEVADIPVPPRRPAEFSTPVVVASLAATPVRRSDADAPGQILPRPGLPRLIPGAQPVLPTARFMPAVWLVVR